MIKVYIVADGRNALADMAANAWRKCLNEPVVVEFIDKEKDIDALLKDESNAVILADGRTFPLKRCSRHLFGLRFTSDRKSVDERIPLLIEPDTESDQEMIPMNWRTDPILLPVVSDRPAMGIIRKMAQVKMLMHVASKNPSPELMQWLDEQFPEVTEKVGQAQQAQEAQEQTV